MIALLRLSPFSGNTTWSMPWPQIFRPARLTAAEKMGAVLREMDVTPLEPDSAQDFMQAVITDPSTTEFGTARRITSRWDRYTFINLPREVPQVPHQLRRLVDDAVHRGAQLGVHATPLVLVADKDPLVGFTFKSNRRQHDILLGGHALDEKHRHLLKGGVLLP